MANSASLLCVHAHPDDEALFTGGLLARYHDGGARTAVVTCTGQDGDRRVDELRQSLQILGAGAPRLLGYRNSTELSGDVPFCDALLKEVVGRLVAHLRDFRPDIVLTYDAFGTSGHPDHIQAHRVTLIAIEAAGYAQFYPAAGAPWRPKTLCQVTFPRSQIERIWRALFGGESTSVGPGIPGIPDDEVDVTVDVRPWVARKWSAVLAHQSELTRGGGLAQIAALPEEVREQHLATESFLYRDLIAPDRQRPPLL